MGKPSISSAGYRQFYDQKRKIPVYVFGDAGVEAQETGATTLSEALAEVTRV